jgi:hypothetical protein
MGVIHGKGKHVWEDGCYYDGEWEHGKRCAVGYAVKRTTPDFDELKMR